jgi:protein-S-isoprenylcysteine O-methyltransferase Ste14
MYLGFVLALIGIAVMLGSLSPWLIVVIFASLMERVFIQVEERMLEARFGQSWLEYKARVRRWF